MLKKFTDDRGAMGDLMNGIVIEKKTDLNCALGGVVDGITPWRQTRLARAGPFSTKSRIGKCFAKINACFSCHVRVSPGARARHRRSGGQRERRPPSFIRHSYIAFGQK